jgi:carboxymethylenebutenolidase
MISIMREARARTGPTFDDIDAAREWLAHREDCTGSIGVTGGRRLLPCRHGYLAQ